jgi:hypothetical protein
MRLALPAFTTPARCAGSGISQARNELSCSNFESISVGYEIMRTNLGNPQDFVPTSEIREPGHHRRRSIQSLERAYFTNHFTGIHLQSPEIIAGTLCQHIGTKQR